MSSNQMLITDKFDIFNSQNNLIFQSRRRSSAINYNTTTSKLRSLLLIILFVLYFQLEFGGSIGYNNHTWNKKKSENENRTNILLQKKNKYILRIQV